MARVQVGDKAPDFTLPSQSGEPVRLQDRIGERVVVLYFYPKDDTSGCTAEACAFRDSHEAFTGTYGDYLLGKVSKVFPELRREVLTDTEP